MAAKPVPFIDGHNDVLLELHLAEEGAAPFLARRSEGHLDLERAREGGFAAGFFAVYRRPRRSAPRRRSRIASRRTHCRLPGRSRPITPSAKPER